MGKKLKLVAAEALHAPAVLPAAFFLRREVLRGLNWTMSDFVLRPAADVP
jgi:hypothetical protein